MTLHEKLMEMFEVARETGPEDECPDEAPPDLLTVVSEFVAHGERHTFPPDARRRLVNDLSDVVEATGVCMDGTVLQLLHMADALMREVGFSHTQRVMIMLLALDQESCPAEVFGYPTAEEELPN